MTDTEFAYQGNELELFGHAKNWKRYWSAHVRPHLGECVLEVGAGIGANTSHLNLCAREWVCLEPDRKMAASLQARQGTSALAATRIVEGTIRNLPAVPRFDSIIYIDVLEHIEDDAAEIVAAKERLRRNGKLIVLSPAHSWLYSPFDAAIGHFRRYSAKDMRALTCPQLELISLRYLDSIGMLASIANRFVLKPQMPTLSQILVWDRVMVPISRLLDPLLSYRIGKSMIAIWRRC